ncbi:MAG: hypothetical protein APU95_04905 [Hadesarchaea archaeon YNP_N21]|jgi:multiple antibiotic resistance protein|nr:MAG: hypothetical protein APU95_04905 [Hadesarchaea archaeon YNP_N21]
MFEGFVSSFISLFVVMDPFASIPVFLSVTKGKGRNKLHAASSAVGIAAAVLFAFIFFGQEMLSFFRVNFYSLQVAGGIVLLVLGVELVLGFSLTRGSYKYTPAISLIGTPLLTGPGAITLTTILVKEYGRLVVSMAAILALMLCLLVLWFSNYFTRFIGNYGIGTTSRVIGIFLVAIAVELILRGLVSRLAELRVEGIFS